MILRPYRQAGSSAVYRPTAEIHLGRLRSNYRAVANHVGGAKVLAIVKADGYGHGLLPVAQALEQEGVFGFGVALLPEALALRKGGLKNFILHMGRFDPETLSIYTDSEIRLSIQSMDDLEHLRAHHVAGGRTMTAHLKIDTGMGRLGVPYDQAIEALEIIRGSDFIRLEGLFSHFATADEEEPSFVSYQLARFGQFVHMVRKLGMEVDYFHIANSSAIVRYPESHFNMVRPGLMLYGLTPSPHVVPPFEIDPVMELKAPLVLVKQLPKGAPVGYGRTFRTPKPTHIGMVQIGYHDGLPIALSDVGHVGLGGKVYPLVGRVSMDMCNIDLGNDSPPIGSEVLIWGRSDDPRLTAVGQAALAGQNLYELLTQVGNRVERLYVDS